MVVFTDIPPVNVVEDARRSMPGLDVKRQSYMDDAVAFYASSCLESGLLRGAAELCTIRERRH